MMSRRRDLGQDSTVWTEVAAARGRVRSADDGTRSHGPRRIPSSSSMTASIVHTGTVHIPPISSSNAFNYGCIKHTASYLFTINVLYHDRLFQYST